MLTLTVDSIPIITRFTLTLITTKSIFARSIGVASMAVNTLINIWIHKQSFTTNLLNYS